MLLNEASKVLVHGFGGVFAQMQTAAMMAAGTPIVAGVSIGAGGRKILGVPTFDTVAEAVAVTGANTAAVYVPAAGARDAIVENADAGIRLAFVTAEHAPLHDTLFAAAYARERGMWVVGPNSLGITVPGIGLLGSISMDLCRPGPVALISRSGTLTLLTARTLSAAGIGQRVCVHVGGDQICGRNPSEYLDACAADPKIRAVAYCGELGGGKEYALIERLATLGKPLVAMIVGRSAPPGKRMGHAGAIAGAARETAFAKRDALAAAGAIIADHPRQMAAQLASALAGHTA
jgi:succinyl-CoA synthetase alpha subunit